MKNIFRIYRCHTFFCMNARRECKFENVIEYGENMKIYIVFKVNPKTFRQNEKYIQMVYITTAMKTTNIMCVYQCKINICI